MIARLCGILVEKDPPNLVIDVQGVGYAVAAPLSTCLKVPELNSNVILYTHLAVREDAHQLYGFISKIDRDLFRELIRVNGIGPKVALALLSSMESSLLINSILSQDIAALVAVPGVGRKTAERLLIEMRDRLASWSSECLISGAEQACVVLDQKENAVAMQALVRLGYKTQEAEKAIKRFGQEALDTESLIRKVLQGFGQAKIS